jgi:hypothetical protein
MSAPTAESPSCAPAAAPSASVAGGHSADSFAAYLDRQRRADSLRPRPDGTLGWALRTLGRAPRYRPVTPEDAILSWVRIARYGWDWDRTPKDKRRIAAEKRRSERL